MKTLLLSLFALTGLASAQSVLPPAPTPPAVIVTALSDVRVSGGAPLSFTDAFLVHHTPVARTAIHDAVMSYEAALKQSLAEARQAKSDAESRLAENIANQTEVITLAETALAGPGSDAEKLMAIQAALVEARKPRAQREADRLRKEAATKEAERLKLLEEAAAKDAEAASGNGGGNE